MYTVLIVMVVYIHSYYLEAQQYNVALFLQNFTGTKGVGRTANYLFFCISGYLFARNIKNINDVWTKMKKRWCTLLLPYLLWNLIFVLWYVVLENVPGVSGFNNSSGIVEKYWEQPILESLYDLFIAPAAFQLWFLRDLLVMLVFTPILWWIAKRQWMVSLIMALCSTILSVADIFLVGNYHRCTEMGYRRLLSTKMGDCCQFNHICRICRLFGIGK